MNAPSRELPCPVAPRPRKANSGGRVTAALFGFIAFVVSAPAQATQLISIGHQAGNSSTVTAPGIKLTLSKIPEFNASPAWKLTSFTWLSAQRTGSQPTGRGHLLIFDAAKFDPAGKTYAQINSATRGLIATSATYADGAYSFPGEVILERSKSYYFLNSVAITTDRNPKAPHQYGFGATAALNGIERWNGSETTWSSAASPGAPNFSATFTPSPDVKHSAR